MRKESTGSRSESRPEWEQLEDWVRSQVQRLIQELLEEEVTEFLGRAKSALRSDSDSDTGLSERIRQSPEAYAEFGNDTAEAAASPRYRGAVREPAAAAVRQQDQDKLGGYGCACVNILDTDRLRASWARVIFHTVRTRCTINR